jgi:GT2 family glycosyltransferase
MASQRTAPPSVTLVVPTYRRPMALRRALSGLARQADPGVSWELVVVDNDDPPGAEPVVRAVESSFPVRVRLVRELRRGASCARNRGIAEATGTVVAFMDDDVVPEPDWLQRLLTPLLAGRCNAVGGRVVLDPSTRRPPWFDNTWMTRCLAEFAPAQHEQDVEAGDYILTASAAFEAELLRATGGLDEVLGPRPGLPMVNDDVRLCRRFVDLGGTIRYVPDAVVVHELPASRLRRRYLLRRFYAQGRSDWLLERELLSSTRTGGLAAAWVSLTSLVPFHWRALTGRGESGIGQRLYALRALCELGWVAGILRESVACNLERHVLGSRIRRRPVRPGHGAQAVASRGR